MSPSQRSLGLPPVRSGKGSHLGIVLMLAALCCAAFAWAQGAGLQLVVNGNVASRSVRVINGRAYVPLDDVARALNMTVAKRPQGYEMTLAGGANQVEGLRGKVGDTLFDGKWRFRVVDVQVVDEYAIRRDGGLDPGQYGGKAEGDGKRFRTKPGYKFVIVNCHVKNGQKTTQAFGSAYGEHTALADEQGSSYRPIGWDQEGGMFVTKALLPGAGQDLTAIFIVPEGTKLKDLVFTLTNVSDRTPKDVRVSLSGVAGS
jgi:hypothetical protein